jgi:hypothetical protein
MSKPLNLRSSIARQITLGVILAAMAIAGGSAAQAAKNDGGTYRTGTCGSASSQFISLANQQATYGFGGLEAAAQLGQSGSGTAGLILNFKYATPDPTSKNDFRNITINSNDGENKDAKKTTTLSYCFQTEHGTGKIIEYNITLNKLSSSGIGNGFKQASQTSRDFGGLNVKAMVLRRLTITVASETPSNITIGDIELNTDNGRVSPVGINLTPAGCNGLNECPTAAVQAQ